VPASPVLVVSSRFPLACLLPRFPLLVHHLILSFRSRSHPRPLPSASACHLPSPISCRLPSSSASHLTPCLASQPSSLDSHSMLTAFCPSLFLPSLSSFSSIACHPSSSPTFPFCHSSRAALLPDFTLLSREHLKISLSFFFLYAKQTDKQFLLGYPVFNRGIAVSGLCWPLSACACACPHCGWSPASLIQDDTTKDAYRDTGGGQTTRA